MSDNTHTHPDRESYEKIWDTVIAPEIENYQRTYGNILFLLPCAKEEIWNRYIELNDFCKSHYMENSEDKIDRHKVAACYMIAVTTVRPFHITHTEEELVSVAFNEHLAITVALSVLRAFVHSAIVSDKDLPEAEKLAQIKRFEHGIALPNTRHGNYIENFANELHFNFCDGNLSILSIAHELYLLELYTRAQ